MFDAVHKLYVAKFWMFYTGNLYTSDLHSLAVKQVS